MSRCHLAVAMLALGMPCAAFAQAETTSFEYDAQGRLTESSRVGGPASGTVQALAYDRAGNRTNLTVTGASGAAPLGAAEVTGAATAEDVSAGVTDAAAPPGEPEPADAPGPTDDPPVSQGAPLLDPLDPAISPNGEIPEPGA